MTARGLVKALSFVEMAEAAAIVAAPAFVLGIIVAVLMDLEGVPEACLHGLVGSLAAFCAATFARLCIHIHAKRKYGVDL